MQNTETAYTYTREKFARSKEEVPYFPLGMTPKYKNGHNPTSLEEMMSDFERQAGLPSLNGSSGHS